MVSDNDSSRIEVEGCLFELLKIGIGINNLNNVALNALLNLSIEKWKYLMSFSIKQGVSALVFDGAKWLYDTYKKK